jgi:hypothetical protein
VPCSSVVVCACYSYGMYRYVVGGLFPDVPRLYTPIRRIRYIVRHRQG